MHQTFYIDIEEEISSVVDRLNKSMSTDNYFVVPKRALFLQSIVNLKLLKREADKVGKQVFIVTQDEVGASMAERSGIEVLASVDEPEVKAQETVVDYRDIEDASEPVATEQYPVRNKAIRLKTVGSNDFYDETGNLAVHDSQKNKKVASPQPGPKRIAINSIGTPLTENRKPLREQPLQSPRPSMIQPKMMQRGDMHAPLKPQYNQQLDPGKAKSLEKMFTSVKNPSPAPANPSPLREGRIKKAIFGFIVVCIFVFIGTAGYLFLPSAKIIVTPNILKDKLDTNLNASGDVLQSEQSIIPVVVINKDESITLPYEISGTNSVSGKKAHGSLVIYNEYDNNPQTLIATTRLQSEDGKIFRLQKNVVVPGMTTVAGEVKPGAVSAEVVADQAGSDSNVGPMKFTIPGFKDGPKYDKFYAKSTDAMIGGTSDGASGGGAVTQRDIDSAKQKTEAAMTDKLNQEIKDGLSDGEISLAEAEKITITKSTAGAKIGDMVSTFNYTATASVHALVFSENDVRNIIEQSLLSANSSQNMKKSISKVEYSTASADFDRNSIELKVHSEIISTPVIDGEQIKRELLGKTDDQLAVILRKYPAIKNVNVEFSPSFVSRIPQFANRVSVQITPEGQ